MTTTPNLGLTKDAPNEQYDVTRVNANSDRIDNFAGDVNTALAGKQDSIADLAAIRTGAAAGGTAVQPAELETDQQRQDTLEAEDRAALSAQIDAGAKNLLKIGSTTTTHRGVTFTVNADGTVTANGTNDGTGASIFNINTQAVLALPGGEYVLSGCPQGGSSDGYYMDATRSPGASLKDTGAGAAFTVGGDYAVSEFRVVVSRDITVNSVTFSPMICTAADRAISPAFTPYRPSWQEMWEMIQALQA